MNIVSADNIIQFALLVAGQEDDYLCHQLGPIHLIKYVYIADLAFASRNNGETFTGITWKFHKFGPWSFELHERIEPALFAVNATKESFPSDYPDKNDWIRWKLNDDFLFDDLNRKLPFAIASAVKQAVHKFGSTTPELLHFVYSTKPMCHSAPGEFLDFSLSIPPETCKCSSVVVEKKTDRQKKKQKAALALLREKNKNRLDAKRTKRKRATSSHVIVYDDIHHEDLMWLDSLSGDPVGKSKLDVTFSDSVWKSSSRNMHDLS